MAMTFLQAKQTVAGTLGGASFANQLTAAGRAIQDALREFDTDTDWEYKLKTLADMTVSAGTDTYDLKVVGGGTNPKSIYSVRLKGLDKRTLFYVRQREYDRVIRDQEQAEIPVAYTDVVIPSTGNLGIKFLPIPQMATTAQIRIYEAVVIPSADGDVLDVPDQYLTAILWLARGHYIIDRDAADPRGPIYLARGQALVEKAERDDVGVPDEDIRLVPMSEWAGGAMGPDPINDLSWDSWGGF